MTWIEEKYRHVHENIHHYFHDQALRNPASTLRQIEEELECHYFRYGNNWTGRGIVGDTVLTATIDALEQVRATCLDYLKTGHGTDDSKSGRTKAPERCNQPS